MNNLRFTVCSFNLWQDFYWPAREKSLKHFMSNHFPDIVALQELHPKTLSLLDNTLNLHQRIDDDFPGWKSESNIYWNHNLFELVSYGMEDVGIEEEYRNLFWVKLKCKDDNSLEILIATAHFTCCNSKNEMATGYNPRIKQANNTAIQLERLLKNKTPVIFMGDLNEDEHPIWCLEKEGYKSVYAALNRAPVITSPALPLPNKIPAVDDWIFFKGNIYPMTIDVPNCCYEGMVPSDHKPILSTFKFV
jgi:endonuclease/exonuclease/phosphatase family metal-dependent hydrolase